jgi:thiol-disulfide isomerase/thioredoxin
VIATGVLLVVGIAACSSSAPTAKRAGTCLSSVNTAAVPSPGAALVGSAERSPVRLPSQSIACFNGSGSVQLSALNRPSIVNLWASYCLPCHTELPHLEAFAKTAGSSVAVIGVDTADDHGAAQSVVNDLRLTYPMLFDPDQRIYQATAGRGLPATLFVAPGGKVVHVYESGTILDAAHLAALAKTYLGVTVPG